MPNVTTQYRMFVPRRRRIGGGGATVDILPPSTNPVAASDFFTNAPQTIDVVYNGEERPAHFIFWSVRGSADGEYTQGTTSLDAHLDSSTPLQATAWYCLSGGGGGPGTPELETDAFLVDLDTFVDTTPIQSVSPAAAWDHSDAEEFVFTAESSDVFAKNDVADDTSERFERWYTLEGGAVPAGQTLQVPQGDDGIAIATFRIPPRVGIPPVNVPASGGTIVGGVAHDGSGGIIVNGIYHPIGPWDPFLAGIAVLRAAVALPAASRVRVEREALRAISAHATALQRQLDAPALKERIG